MEICKECKRPFLESHGQGGFKKIFCSPLCKSRFNSRERYERVKNDPIEKQKKQTYYKVWYQKNKEKHNSKMRDYMRNYLKKKKNNGDV